MDESPPPDANLMEDIFTQKKQFGRAPLHVLLPPLAVAATIVAGALFLRPQAAPRGVVVASFATSLRGRTPDQVVNMRRGARVLDGGVPQPGQTVFVVRTLGPITAEAGHLPALAVRDGGPPAEDRWG